MENIEAIKERVKAAMVGRAKLSVEADIVTLNPLGDKEVFSVIVSETKASDPKLDSDLNLFFANENLHGQADYVDFRFKNPTNKKEVLKPVRWTIKPLDISRIQPREKTEPTKQLNQSQMADVFCAMFGINNTSLDGVPDNTGMLGLFRTAADFREDRVRRELEDERRDEIIAQLQTENKQLKEQVEELEDENDDLQEQVEQLSALKTKTGMIGSVLTGVAENFLTKHPNALGGIGKMLAGADAPATAAPDADMADVEIETEEETERDVYMRNLRKVLENYTDEEFADFSLVASHCTQSKDYLHQFAAQLRDAINKQQ